jgi:hypothetical protein
MFQLRTEISLPELGGAGGDGGGSEGGGGEGAGGGVGGGDGGGGESTTRKPVGAGSCDCPMITGCRMSQAHINPSVVTDFFTMLIVPVV